MSNLQAPKSCVVCRDRRIKVYTTLYSVADDAGQACVWQCYGCGALLEPGVYRTTLVGYAAVVMVHGIRGEGEMRVESTPRPRQT